MEYLDKTSARPLYQQLDDILREKILSGVWKENQIIPSENELARTYQISRVTARAVVKNLVNDGLLYRVQGKGTFVAKPKIMTRSSAPWGGISNQLEHQGMQTETMLVDFQRVEPSDSVARKLKISRDDLIWFVECVCNVDGMPLSIHKTYIPYALCPTLTADVLKRGKLYELMRDQYNLTPDVIHETLETTQVTEKEAEYLQIKKREVSILVESINQARNGTIYRFDKIIFRGDKIKLRFDYGEESST